jgi:hypothetical protein
MPNRGSCASYEIIEIKDCIIVLFDCDARVIFESMHSLPADWVPYVDKDIIIQPHTSIRHAPPCPHQLNFDAKFALWCIQTRKIQHPCWLALRAEVDRSLFSQKSRSSARKVRVELCMSEQTEPLRSHQGAPAIFTPPRIQVQEGTLSPEVSDGSLCPPFIFFHPNNNPFAQSRLMNTFLPEFSSLMRQDSPFQEAYFSSLATKPSPIPEPSPLSHANYNTPPNEVPMIMSDAAEQINMTFGFGSPVSFSQDSNLEIQEHEESIPPKNSPKKTSSTSKLRRSRKKVQEPRPILPGPV